MSETGHSQASGPETEGTGDIQKVLQMLLDDRRKREEEIAAERRQREEEIAAERRQREQEAVAERERQERETERRLQEMQKHVDALLKVVEKSHDGTSGAKREARGAGDEKEVRLTKLSEADDVEAYLTTFERMMTAFEVQKERWVFKLAPYLTGKAQQAYAAMAAEDAGEYECLKAAILKRYNINEETYRVRFRAVARKPEEGYAEMATRVMDLLRKWTRECTSMEEVMEVVAVEQMLNSLPAEVRVWVRERKPRTVAEVGKLADDFAQARGQTKEGRSDEGRPVEEQKKECYRCGLVGHLARECRNRGPYTSVEQRTQVQTGKRESVKCYNCGQQGHIASRCPSRVALYTALDRTGQDVDQSREELKVIPPILINGEVNGTAVRDILVDTGTNTTIVSKSLVSEEQLMGEEAHVSIQCAHGDTVKYPLARVMVRLAGKSCPIVAAVSESLPVSVLLGRDVPVLAKLLREAHPPKTKAQKCLQQRSWVSWKKRRKQSGVWSCDTMAWGSIARAKRNADVDSGRRTAVSPEKGGGV